MVGKIFKNNIYKKESEDNFSLKILRIPIIGS